MTKNVITHKSVGEHVDRKRPMFFWTSWFPWRQTFVFAKFTAVLDSGSWCDSDEGISFSIPGVRLSSSPGSSPSRVLKPALTQRLESAGCTLPQSPSPDSTIFALSTTCLFVLKASPKFRRILGSSGEAFERVVYPNEQISCIFFSAGGACG